MSVAGEILLTCGALLLLFAYYESYWTNIEAHHAQEEAATQMEDRWEHVNPRQAKDLQLGEAFARMYIPAFGSDFHFVIVEGTGDDDLLKGPGRYTDTQLPGEPGNFAVAGHRVGKGAPFNDLGNLHTCDAVVVETRNSWDVYRMLPVDSTDPQQRRTEAAKCLNPEQVERVAQGDYAAVQGRRITLPGDVSTIEPIPGVKSGVLDTMEPLMTMTTCHPQFSNKERMIIHAMMVRSDPKDPAQPDYRPPELEENK